jgi:hypothetical protein
MPEGTSADEKRTDIAVGVSTEESRGLMDAPLSQRELATIQAMMLLARRFPRDETTARAKLLELCESRTFAEKATYSFKRGRRQADSGQWVDNYVSGASVKLARAAAAKWGNISTSMLILRAGTDSIHIEVRAWDLETNYVQTAQDEFPALVQRKNKDTGKTEWVVPDERDRRELVNRRAALLERNCLIRLIPDDLIASALMTVKETVMREAKQSRAEQMTALVLEFGRFGIGRPHLEAWLAGQRDKPTADLETITPEEIVNLRGVIRSIRDGDSGPDDHFTYTKPREAAAATLDLSGMAPGDPANNTGHDSAPGRRSKGGQSAT